MTHSLRTAVLASILLPALVAALAFTAITALANDGDGDRAALMAIYQATDGDNWKKNGGWGTDRPLARWRGVTVNDDGRVVKLDLRRNKLSGKLPAEIGDLSALRVLNLVSNKLSGPLPAELGQLQALTKLDLSGNRFSGPIPYELGHIWYLERLRLNGNDFTGYLPFDHTSFPSLTTLRIRSNDLEGCIPDHMQDIPRNDFAASGLENCPEDGDRGALMALYDATVGVDWAEAAGWDTGAPLHRWHGVTVDGDGRVSQLNLTGNQLHGPIPADLGNLNRLAELRLVDNSMTGSILAELADIPTLRVLWLAGNFFTGCIPEGLRDVRDNDLDRVGLEDCEEPESEPEPEEKPGVSTLPEGIIWVDEGGETEITVVLTGAPTSDVSVDVDAGPSATDIVMSPATLLFTPKDWNEPQTVVVKAVDDPDSTHNGYVFFPFTRSDDGRYSDEWWDELMIFIEDDD